MKKLKFFAFFVLGLVTWCGSVYAAKKRTDYRPRVEKALEDDSPRIFFEPELVEPILAMAYAVNPEYNFKHAARVYDQISASNDGEMALDDLFFVCMIAHQIPRQDMFDIEKRREMWPICVQEFIRPLLSTAQETAILDDNLTELYDGTIQDQPCTPSEKDDTRSVLNMLCTSGKHSFDPAFEKAMDTKFRTEGGCADVGDGNGITCYGLSSRWNKEVLEPGFSRAMAEDIAYKRYYKNYNIDKLPDAIRGDVFMALWGTGSAKASIGLLQNVLDVPRTNKVDEATITAARNYNGRNLRKQFLKARWTRMKTNGTFSNGWAKAFLIYLKNGCHTVTSDPLERNAQTVAECKKHL